MPAIRLFGLPTDVNSSFERGAAAGPAAIRAQLWSDRGNMASELGPELGTDIAFADDGDLALTEDTPRDDAMIRRHVAPFTGDRSLSGEIEALAAAITCGELREAAGLPGEIA